MKGTSGVKVQSPKIKDKTTDKDKKLLAQGLGAEWSFLTTEDQTSIPVIVIFLKKVGQPQSLFVYFRSFQTQFYRQNFMVQRDSNSDCQSRRQAC